LIVGVIQRPVKGASTFKAKPNSAWRGLTKLHVMASSEVPIRKASEIRLIDFE
jgi:hypothetical protein